VRWDSLRLAAYAEYAHAVKKISSIAVRVATHGGIHHDLGALPPEAGLPALTWAQAIAAASKARRGFYESAKADVGIAVGESPETYEWQLTKLVPVDGDSAHEA